ncbi:ABC transporter permease [Eisenbergiella tayi]|uniref:Putative multiple-sugar transport system permease YteP n=1 Tax=Eisenbergiella tayi TaxID=1432052 RepID=A0A1E3AER0_9FIRM|nr:ABC transporter permease subunit [Eisenbergiella tayi]ODM07204.1 putative multiple-sugar transport system permease YteP [Eisenbergiella tayi]
MKQKSNADGFVQKKGFHPEKAFRKDWQLWVMILPAIMYILIFCYGPMYGLQLAFRDYDFSKGITGGNWAGIKYFMQYFQSPMFGPTIRNTFIIAFFSLICGFPVPIILAIAINSIKRPKWKRSVQTAVYLPYFISTVVLVAILQILLSPSTGLLSHALKAVGLIGGKANLLGDPSAFVPVYVISGIWQSAGWNSIIFIAALAAVDGQLYDAAKVDGANRWQQVWHVELPAILPTIIILLIMNMGGILSVGFEKTFLMQNALNKSVSEVISTYVYNVGLKSSQFSFGSAVGLFNTVVNFIFLVLANQISKRAADISLM